MGTKLTELRNGCFARALDDEPMFVLLARDDSAPGSVDAWADNREAEIFAQRRPSSDLEVVAEARACARNMRKWRAENDGKWRTGLFADRGPEQDFYGDPPASSAIMPELRGQDAFVSFGKAAGNVVSSLRPRTGDAAWDYENANGGCMLAAVHNAAGLYGTIEQRAASEAAHIQTRYGLSDAKRDAIAADIVAHLNGDEDIAQMAYLDEWSSKHTAKLLPWYVWATLLFVAGYVVGKIVAGVAGC